MATPVAIAKRQLRSIIKQRISNLSQDAILTQSRAIFEALTNFKPYRDANRISIYLSMPSTEVQTDAIVRHALGCGKQVFVPYLHKSTGTMPDTPVRVMDMVHLKTVQDYEALARDRWDIPSIDPSSVGDRERILGDESQHVDVAAGATLDLMLVPGVAFDLDDGGAVRRLGHGKGFYDYFLNRYFTRAAEAGGKGASLQLYGLALTEQLLDPNTGEEVPMGFYDRKLHGLIVGDGQLRQSS